MLSVAPFTSIGNVEAIFIGTKLCLAISSAEDDFLILSFKGISLINSTDSYSPRINPSLGGHSGCLHGLDTTMNWRGADASDAGNEREESEEDSAVAKDDVKSRVTKSLGTVGPGTCAERSYQI